MILIQFKTVCYALRCVTRSTKVKSSDRKVEGTRKLEPFPMEDERVCPDGMETQRALGDTPFLWPDEFLPGGGERICGIYSDRVSKREEDEIGYHQRKDQEKQKLESPFALRTTPEEIRKFGERLKKYRERISQHKKQASSLQSYQRTIVSTIMNEEKIRNREVGEEETTRYINLEQEEQMKKEVERNKELTPILKRPLPSSSAIDEMEANEQERQVRHKLASEVKEIQQSIQFFPEKPSKNYRDHPQKRMELNISKNSALYDFLTVSVCGSPVSPKPTEICVLQRSISAPASFLVHHNHNDPSNVILQSDRNEEHDIGDFISSADFWKDIFFMESEIPILN